MMISLNKSKRKIINYFLNLLLLILIIFYNNDLAYGANENWIEVSKTKTGMQYLDMDSLSSKGKDLIEIKTKYLKVDPNDFKEIEENIYEMRINCSTNKFKDISVNGKRNLSANWVDPNGDQLIIDVIYESCKNG